MNNTGVDGNKTIGFVTALRLPRFKMLSFWHYQLAGWSLLVSVHLLINIATVHWPVRTYGLLILELAACFGLTLLLRRYYHTFHIRKKSIFSMLVAVVIGSLIGAGGWLISVDVLRYLILPTPEFTELQIAQRILSDYYALFPIPFAWSCLYFGIKLRMNYDLEKQRAKEAVVLAQRAQLQMLQYQINPHFLFNVLNSLRALIDEDPKAAKMMVSELSEFLQYSLLDRSTQEVLLKNELSVIRQYLSIQQKGYEDKLEASFDIDPRSEDIPILGFLIHPLVENAVKYGMKTSPMPLKIRIETAVLNETLRIGVLNTGQWIDAAAAHTQKPASTGTGLENIKARLHNAYPGNHSVSSFEQDGWVHVIIEFTHTNRNHHEE